MNLLRSHRKITLITDGQSNPFVAKTAISMLRYRNADVVAVLDGKTAAKTAEELFSTGGTIPIVRDLSRIKSDALYVGIAPPGGRLPSDWRPLILDAIARKMDIVSGLHDFLNADPEYVKAAKEAGVHLVDVRDNQFDQIATARPFRDDCLRIHAVGQDCSIGKMVAMMELTDSLSKLGQDAVFLATGQTGIMISGDGIPVDRVVSDFVNGAAESLVRQHEHHEILLIEGQGSVTHPAYSAVTLGLLHGCAPQGMIFCYEAGRTHVKGFDSIELPPIDRQMDLILDLANVRHPSRFLGIAVNTRNLHPTDADNEVRYLEQTFQLPACDVYRHGAKKLAQACVDFQRQRRQPANHTNSTLPRS